MALTRVSDLGKTLREMRMARGLSLGAAASLAEVTKSGIASWESGTRPRGPALARYLDALGTEPRLRARLLHDSDPAHARIALAGTSLGAAVDVGMVIRAMRGRRGATQAELARAVGVTQSAAAHWEAGESAPSGATIHAIGFALGATVEETVALACANGADSGRLPDEAPEVNPNNRYFGDANVWELPDSLHEIVALGLEAELWTRAVRDARWDPWLCDILGKQAIRLFGHGRLGEAEEMARRALRIAPTPRVRSGATLAFSTLLEIALHKGAEPALLADRIGAWSDKLPNGVFKGWMLWERGLRMAEMGRPDEALDLVERTGDQYALDPGCTSDHVAWTRTFATLKIEIRAGRGDRAAALLPDCDRWKDRGTPLLAVQVAHLNGEAASEATMAAMRATDALTGRDREWYGQGKIAEIEREQARLAYSAMPS